jgi:hypothetical protein
MTGRPTLYSPTLAATMCERIANGETLKAICKGQAMPSQSTVFGWLARYPQFSELYARARETSADVLIDEAREIADDGSADYVIRSADGKAELAVNHEHIARSKLRIEQRRWEASKRKPRAYGDRQYLEHSGSMEVNVNITKMTDEELVQRLLELQATGRFKPPGGAEIVEGIEDDYSDIA